ncbi:MAG TPA: Gfo/Idh/MocA family oxidoreductase [Planctomycetaceae bacterium]|nr:Gfo/Idh/MocA family oxidoreductase [Planctomycetaceae bacterium]
MRRRTMLLGAAASPLVPVLARAAESAGTEEKPLRAGIIGLDTSHAIAFTKVLNDPNAPGELAGVQVVAAYPGGSRDLPASWERVPKYTEQMRGMGVEICDSIEALLEKVDVVLLESLDGRPHLEQARPVIDAGKPLFIDKPMAGSLADVLEIFRLARQAGVPCFSSSSLRYGEQVQQMRHDPPIGRITGCAAFSPCSLEEHHPDLFWYGVHGVEPLFAIMQTGCQQVTRVQTESTELAVGVWADGRVGTFRGRRSKPHGYGVTVFGEKGVALVGKFQGYTPLLVEICRFFKTGKPPVHEEETIEIFAFMEAADESKRRGGCPVTIKEVLAKAQQTKAHQ